MKVRALAVGLAVLVAGCGAKKPVSTPPDLSGLEAADALVAEGCYDCLLDARAIYRHIGAGAGRPVVRTRLFETNLLLGLRHKELALDPAEPFAEARAVAAELAPEVEASRYLALAEAVPGDDTGLPRRQVEAFRRERAQEGFVPRVDAELAWLDTGALRRDVRDYLALAVDCAYPNRPHTPPRPNRRREVRQPPAGAPPLIAYRTAICEIVNQPALYRLRNDDPRWVEASLFLARVDIALIEQFGPGRAAERLDEGRARFPASPLALYLSGSYQQAIGDYGAALAFYDEMLALQPRHEDALLGRTMCLTFTSQRDAAIATATRLIELDVDVAGWAYYWRAWNQHDATALDPARADIEQAKTRNGVFQVYTLAGVIEYDQGDIGQAERDLRTARLMVEQDMNCTAIWYLSLVQTKKSDWPAAASRFEDSLACYERTAALNASERRGIEGREDLDPRYRTRKLASLDAAIKEATSQKFASALNAANYHAVAGHIAAARKFIEIAAEDTALADKVNKLKDWLKDKLE